MRCTEILLQAFTDPGSVLENTHKHPLMDLANILAFIERFTGRPLPLTGSPAAVSRLQLESIWNANAERWGRVSQFSIGVTCYKDCLFLVDAHRIQKIDSSGKVVPDWMPSPDIKFPTGLQWYDDELYVVDTFRNRVQVFDTRGTLCRVFSLHATGFAVDVAVNTHGVFITDTRHHCVWVFAHDGTLRSQWGCPGTRGGEFSRPTGITCSDSRLFVTDRLNHRVQVLDSASGEWIHEWGQFGTSAGEFRIPWGIATLYGCVYVVDTQNNRMQAFSTEGKFLYSWGCSVHNDTPFSFPSGVCTDGTRVFVTDRLYSRVSVLGFPC